MITYQLNNEEGIMQGMIQTSASEEVVQNYWNQVYSDVYLFEERRHIERENNNITGNRDVVELVILLKFRGYADTTRVYEGEEVISINGNNIG